MLIEKVNASDDNGFLYDWELLFIACWTWTGFVLIFCWQPVQASAVLNAFLDSRYLYAEHEHSMIGDKNVKLIKHIILMGRDCVGQNFKFARLITKRPSNHSSNKCWEEGFPTLLMELIPTNYYNRR